MFTNKYYFLFKKCKNNNEVGKYDFIEIDHIEKDSFYGKDDEFKLFLKQRIEQEKELTRYVHPCVPEPVQVIVYSYQFPDKNVVCFVPIIVFDDCQSPVNLHKKSP